MSSKNYYYKLFRVTKACGKISTISMDPVLVTKACQVLGGLEKVNEFAKETALKYSKETAGMNCSAFVSKALKENLKEMILLKNKATTVKAEYARQF